MLNTVVAVVLVAAMVVFGAAPAGAVAKFGTVTVDGSPSEWAFASTEFDTGARPCTAGSNPWDLSGVKATFAYDNTNLYALFQGYPDCGAPDNANGPLGAVTMDLYIYGVGEVAHAYRLSECPDFNPACSEGNGKTVAWSGDGMTIELSIPLTEIQSSQAAFDPAVHFLSYSVAIADTDGTGGFDSAQQTAGFVSDPVSLTWRYYRLDFESLSLGGPASAGQCMRGGWRHFTSPRTFQSQRDCVHFVRTGR
jgi:hypothetical protein